MDRRGTYNITRNVFYLFLSCFGILNGIVTEFEVDVTFWDRQNHLSLLTYFSVVGRPKQNNVKFSSIFELVSSFNGCMWKGFTFEFNSFVTQGLRAL